ncbi:nucleotide sugar dehydrogenase [uncultured Gulosibacter sp.]|uniref:nucleotide sugar dehydrogenase n=1 Tax=uncultured Gulosibacter sp. TaxID=1339167 RepID=UPI00288B9869|nr:nucleotide sugar dehydrogenase [uncultured Gulosibacter sp.]
MKIAVIGLGYVGVANAVLLAQSHEVVAVDVQQSRVDAVNERRAPVADDLVTQYLANKQLNLRGTLDFTEAVTGADYVVVATPTDYDEVTDSFNTSTVEAVLQQVAESGERPTVVIKSTIPIGFTTQMSQRHPELNILFSPEFLREGKALYDNLHPSRIVVAGDREKAAEFAELLHAESLDPNTRVLITGTTEAEAIKLFSNTYLAMRVAYFNELDTYARRNNLDAREIIDGVGLDPRIGSHYNNPSFGYGGYCLPKDTKQLLANYRDIPQRMMTAIVESNTERIRFIADDIQRLQPKQVGVCRLAMKSGSDNFRSSAVLAVVDALVAAGVNVKIYEPTASGNESFAQLLEPDFDRFVNESDVIITNRVDEELKPHLDKVYSRDIFGRD